MDAEALARRSQKGDREAFARIYELYAKRIYAYLYYRSCSRETAEDLTATVFMKALEKLDGFRPELGGFSGWIYAIARNALADHFRRRDQTVSLESVVSDVWDLPGCDDVALDAENRELWETVKSFVAALGSEQREILLLRVWDDLPYAEIARISGKTEGACKMCFSRALSSLREAMPLSLFIAFLMMKPPAA